MGTARRHSVRIPSAVPQAYAACAHLSLLEFSAKKGGVMRGRGSSRRSSSSRSAHRSSGGRQGSSKPAYTYQANLKGGKKYIGMATSKSALQTRIKTQLRGGAGASSVCRHSKPLSVTKVFKHTNVAAAKKAETARYHSTKAILGAHKVRGAGHTKAFGK